MAVTSPSRPASPRLAAPLARGLIVAILAGALAPAPAGAVLLWKRKGARAAPAAPAAPAADSLSQPTTADVVDVVGQATAALRAPERIPTPQETANYPHELRSLSAAWPAEDVEGPVDRAVALLRYGNALAELNRDPAAARAYALALELNPKLQAAGVNLGSLLRRAGELDLSESICREVIGKHPRAGTAWYNLAVTLEAKGDLDGSDEAYLEALKWSPQLWLPTHNPLIVGNQRARYALHHNYLAGSVRGSIFLDHAR